MKKTLYIAPKTISIAVRTQSHLLGASQVEFSSTEYGGGTHRSHEGSGLWDDEDK